jgi:AraC-like DNA-binding protein
MYFRIVVVLIALFGFGFMTQASDAHNLYHTDLKKFYSLKKEAGSSPKYFRYIRDKMSDYYSNSQPKCNASLFDRFKENSVAFENNPTDFVIHALVVSNIALHTNERMKITPLIHTMEQKIKHIKDKNLLVFAEQVIGLYFIDVEKYPEALQHTINALKYAKILQDTINYQVLYYTISSIYYADGNYKKSEEYITKTIYYEQFGFKDLHYDCMMAYALLAEHKKGKPKDALAIYLDLMDEVAEEDKAVFYNNLGRTYYELSDYSKAEKSLLISKKHAKISRNDLLESVYSNLSDCYLKTENFERSFHYLVLKDSVVTAQKKAESLAELEELKKQDLIKIQTLQKKNAQEKLLHEQTKTVRLVLSLIFLVVLLASVILFALRLRLKNRTLVRISFDKMKQSHLIEKDAVLTESVRKISPLLLDKFELILHEKEIFKDPDLTIQKLAKRLGTNVKDLSQTINGYYGIPFRTLINEKRIELAKHMLLEEKYLNYSMAGIAKSVGYASKTSFYKHFKEMTGVTPSNFQSYALKLIQDEIQLTAQDRKLEAENET